MIIRSISIDGNPYHNILYTECVYYGEKHTETLIGDLLNNREFYDLVRRWVSNNQKTFFVVLKNSPSMPFYPCPDIKESASLIADNDSSQETSDLSNLNLLLL